MEVVAALTTMGLGLRIYFILDGDRIVPMPQAKYLRVYDRSEALRQFAGVRIRCAEIAVDLENRAPTGRYREVYHLLPFDDDGLVDRKETFRGVHLALDAAPPLLSSQEPEGGSNIIPARGRFAKAQLDHQFRWQPGHRLRQQILDLALGRKRLR